MKIDERCIRQTEVELARLEEALKEAFKQRGGSASGPRWVAWKSAAERFHRYESPVFALWSDEARSGVLQGEGAWRESAMRYVALSPRFLRSGYLRDRLCHLLKQCALSGSERCELRRVLLDAVVRQPSVGRFRHDCQLAARWADEEFTSRVRALSQRKDGWTRGRAQRMLDAIEQNKNEWSREP
ncbi:hypothetical protein [Variovorax sp. RO1]|uniref:hypothetical protein n=1 Tax=Variovorax sp. RO1 TaxID=2066034 RepID=UPI00117C85E4|nr:hypothetical protein [Variovorax sp. RO1]